MAMILPISISGEKAGKVRKPTAYPQLLGSRNIWLVPEISALPNFTLEMAVGGYEINDTYA